MISPIQLNLIFVALKVIIYKCRYMWTLLTIKPLLHTYCYITVQIKHAFIVIYVTISVQTLHACYHVKFGLFLKVWNLICNSVTAHCNVIKFVY